MGRPVVLQVGDRTVRCSNPEQPYFPDVGLTKIDVVRYYQAVADVMLRQIRDRPTTLERWPTGVVPGVTLAQRDGTKGQRSTRSGCHRGPDYVETCRISFPAAAPPTRSVPLNRPCWCGWPRWAPSRCIPGRCAATCPTLPTSCGWTSTQPGTGFSDAVDVAQAARHLMADRWGGVPTPRPAAAGVRCMSGSGVSGPSPTSGTPPSPSGGPWSDHPGRVTTAWWKEERGETVFVDLNQNSRDRTIAAAWSVRARPAATVSTPVTWDELAQCEPGDFTVRTVPDRLFAGDPWADLDDVAHDLTGALQLYAPGRARPGPRRYALPARIPQNARRAAAGAAEPQGQTVIAVSPR